MNRRAAIHNLGLLSIVAHRLEELCNEVTFVGGCVVELLITDKAAPDVRFTVDVDCIINVVTLHNYHALAEKLRQKKFKEIPYGDHPICRWDCQGVLVDIVPIEKNVLGFSNRWYKEAQENAFNKNITDSISVNVITAPYFLATKLEAFKDRGKQDVLISHDIEDIISVIDGRPEVVDEVLLATDELKDYLSSAFSALLMDSDFLQVLPGHLNYGSESEIRKNVVLERMRAIAR
jgi:predicted nucleotidyltransferase